MPIKSAIFSLGLWADFGSRIAISEKNVRMDCPLYDDYASLDNLAAVRKSAHKPS